MVSTEARAWTTSETGSVIRRKQKKEERNVRNPMWFAAKNLAKVKRGTCALEHEFARGVRAVDRALSDFGLDESFRAEIGRQVLRSLVLLVIELGLLSLVRRLMPARPPARVYPLPVPQPAS